MYPNVFIAATSLVAVAEIGDKTQLLSFMLAARFSKPFPIILGIFVATLCNHALAALVGHSVGAQLDSHLLHLATSIIFIIIGVWTLIPDKLDEEDAPPRPWGAFLTTTVTFFLAEMGDKTQFATLVLGAEYASMTQVILGTTFGMLLANIPAVFLGKKLLARIPLSVIRTAAAILFVGFGIVKMLSLLMPFP